MVDCWWRLTRAMRVEAEFLEQRANAINEANPDLAGDAALGSMFINPSESRSFRLFMRYLTNAQNAWRQACAEFEAARKAAAAAATDSASDPLPAPSGFVSQSDESPTPSDFAPVC